MQIQLIIISIIFSIIIDSSMTNHDFTDACQNGFKTGNWEDCANSLSTFIWNTNTWSDDEPINICKLKCAHKLKGRISRFRLVWDANFECGEETLEIIGTARGFKIRQMAMKHAIAQAIERAIAYGKYTPNDFKCD